MKARHPSYKEVTSHYQRGKVNIEAIERTYDREYYRELVTRETDIYTPFLSKYRNYIQEPILDFGCGAGGFMLAAKHMGLRIIGADISRDSLDICRERGLDALILCDNSGELKELASDSIGTVYSSQVIEHIPRAQADKLLKEFHRVLRPNGTMMLFFPAECSRVYNPDPTHVNFYKTDEFLEQVRAMGFSVERFWSLLFIPPYDRYIMQISWFMSRWLPTFNRYIYGARKASYQILKRFIKRTPGTQINIIARKSVAA